MMKSYIFVFTLLFSFYSIGYGEDDPKRTDLAKKTAEQMREKILIEVGELGEDHWAGEYIGDGINHMIALTVAPENGFVFESFGWGMGDRNYGRVEEKDGIITLNFEFENKLGDFQGIDPTLNIVKWGERPYLIPDRKMIEFCNLYNHCRAGNLHVDLEFLIKGGGFSGLEHKVSGKPSVPEKYQPYLLDKPICAKVSHVEYAVLTSCEYSVLASFDKLISFDTIITLDVGRNDGALIGMEFLPMTGSSFEGIVTVCSVSGESCKAIHNPWFQDKSFVQIGCQYSTE